MKNNYLLLTLALLSFCMGSNAQITVTNTTFPAVGDVLSFAFDANPTITVFTPPGGPQTWDFSSLTAGTTQQQLFQAASAGTASAAFPDATLLYVNGNVEYYYKGSSQVFQLLGYRGPDPIGLGFTATVKYNPLLTERRSPMNFFDINAVSSGIFLLLKLGDLPPARQQAVIQALGGNTPDSLRIRTAISRTDVVDGFGEVTLPGGTRFPVLREKRTQYTETRLDAKIAPLGWLDVTNDVIQKPLGLTGLGVDTTVTYNFFNNTSKEPIAVVTLNQDQATPRLVQYKLNRMTTDVTNLESESPQLLDYPNPASDKLNLRFTNMKPGQYFLKIYNILGIEVGNEIYQISGKQFDTDVDITKFGAGTYLLQLKDMQDTNLISKQLIVVK
jgi:hypothetical protein